MTETGEDLKTKAKEELQKIRQNCEEGLVRQEIENLAHYAYKAGIRLADIGASKEELEDCLRTGNINAVKTWLKMARERPELADVETQTAYIQSLAAEAHLSLADIGISKQELKRLLEMSAKESDRKITMIAREIETGEMEARKREARKREREAMETEARKVCSYCGSKNRTWRTACDTCGRSLVAVAITELAAPAIPVRLDVEYPESLSRLLLFVKWLLVIPLYIALALYGMGAFLVTFVAFWIILFTGHYPQGMFDFVRGYMAWQFKVYAYFPILMTDDWYPDEVHSLEYKAKDPDRLSRLILVFLKLPSFLLGIVLNLINVGWLLLVLVAIPIWWIILFTGKYPRKVFRFSAGVLEWVARVTAWQWLMRDEFSLFGTTHRVRMAVWVGIIGTVIIAIVSAVVMPG